MKSVKKSLLDLSWCTKVLRPSSISYTTTHGPESAPATSPHLSLSRRCLNVNQRKSLKWVITLWRSLCPDTASGVPIQFPASSSLLPFPSWQHPITINFALILFIPQSYFLPRKFDSVRIQTIPNRKAHSIVAHATLLNRYWSDMYALLSPALKI
jgi:hypothetical protein